MYTDFTKSLRQPEDVAEEEPNANEPENTGAGLDADEFFGFSLEKLRSMRTASCLGCLTLDILDPPAGTKWSHFNDRRVDQDWLRKLTDKFGGEKLDHCTDGTAMEIAVRPHWVANLKKALDKVDGKYIHQVDELELTPIGRQEIMQENLWVLGGNHRRLALKSHVAKLRVKLEQLKEEDVHLRAKTVKAGQVVGSTKAEALSKKALEDMEVNIKNSSKWAVRLYDRGERGKLFSI